MPAGFGLHDPLVLKRVKSVDPPQAHSLQLPLVTGRLISTAFRRSCPEMGSNCSHGTLFFLRLASRRLRLESPR